MGEANPVRRLERVAASMRRLKKGRQAAATFGALAAVGMAPAGVQSLALDLFSRKASAVATNVPGPQMPLYLGGSEIREMMFWVPQTGSIGLGLSILSYNGRVHFGLIGDARLLPDPDASVADFERILADLETSGLHELEQEWRDSLLTLSGNDLTDLDSALGRSLREIRDRIQPINDILADLPFYDDEHRLQITTRENQSDVRRRFRAELRAAQ